MVLGIVDRRVGGVPDRVGQFVVLGGGCSVGVGGGGVVVVEREWEAEWEAVICVLNLKLE